MQTPIYGNVGKDNVPLSLIFEDTIILNWRSFGGVVMRD
jgi:hypothetical protein